MNKVKTRKKRAGSTFQHQAGSKEDIIKVKTNGLLLTINKKNGIVKLGDIHSEFNPTSEEFRVLLKMATNENHIATYEDLLKDNSKSNRRDLTFTIRNIKENLQILPKKNAKNKDCIKNIKLHGYKLT